jgi:cAMP-specific phosphodiesterase 4
LIVDKQQELDLPSLRVDDSEAAKASAASRGKAKDATSSSATSLVAKTGGSSSSSAVSVQPSASTSGSHVGRAMSHISGVKRPLSHSNSVTTSEKVAKYGVDTPNEHELGKVIKFIECGF